MRASGFMIPADEATTVEPTDTIGKAMDLMLEKKVGCLLVMVTGTYHVPIGIVTKSDFLRAYKDGVKTTNPVKQIMSKDLMTCPDTLSRDQVARALERNKKHHIVVVNKDLHFLGLISSWDISVECARDDRAWPWNRAEDGKFHKPMEEAPMSPTGVVPDNVPANSYAVLRRSQMGDSFRAYVDTLGYFD